LIDCRLLARFVLPILWILAGWVIPPQARAQTPTPTPAPAATARPREESFTLELLQDLTGTNVRMPNLLALLDHLFPGGVTSRWDPLDEILRIDVQGKAFDLWARRPVVMINGTMNTVARAVMMRQGELQVPVETVELILKTMGIEYEINAPPPPTPTRPTPPAVTLGSSTTLPLTSASTPAGVEAARIAQPTSTPLPTPPIFEMARTAPTSSTTSAEAPVLPRVMLPVPVEGATATPGLLVQPPALTASGSPLEPPPALAGRIGLSWGQLADLAHREPPSRLTIVCDAALEEIARQVAQSVQVESNLATTVLVAPTARRDDETLALRVAQSQPGLMMDLMASPPAGDMATAAFQIWVVHEYLWPRDLAGGAQAPSAQMQRYRRHEFQNLALGSVMRVELGRQFPDRVVLYDLAPLTLLARVDAPAAAVLLPVDAEGKPDPDGSERIGRALAAGVADYVRGMRQVRF
jgi:hypothetical protein